MKIFKEHWKDSGANYLAVVSGNQTYVWFTGNGENILKNIGVKTFGPGSFGKARLRSGSPGDGKKAIGKIRVIVDIGFNLSDGVEICAEGGAFVNENASSDLHKIIREILLS